MTIPAVSPGLAAGSLIVGAVVYFLGVAIYRLTIHPLAVYPGPWLAKISGWPDAISAMRGRKHLDIFLLHCQYGDKVKYAPNSISFNTIEALRDIHGDRTANLKKTGWTAASEYIHQPANLHTFSDKRTHAARKRLVAHAFSENALRQAEDLMLSTVRNWCAHLAPKDDARLENDGWSPPKDMGLARSGGFKRSHFYLSNDPSGRSYANQRSSPWFSPEAARRRMAYRQEMRKLTAERHQAGLQAEKSGVATRKDFFYYLLRARDPETGAKIEPAEFVGEAALLVGAGSDTSSTAMAATFFYLLRNSAALRRLQDELRGAFSDVEEIRSGSKLSSLSWLRACVDETMRMTPPVPGMLPRVVLPGGTTVDGHYFEAGIDVGTTAYAIHHNEKYIPDSFSYLPERWIEGEQTPFFTATKDSITLNKSAFCAFSLGNRQCIGKNLAYMELLVGIARVMWLYDIRASGGCMTGGGSAMLMERGRERTNEYQALDWLISEKEGPVVQFKRRDTVQVVIA